MTKLGIPWIQRDMFDASSSKLRPNLKHITPSCVVSGSFKLFIYLVVLSLVVSRICQRTPWLQPRLQSNYSLKSANSNAVPKRWWQPLGMLADPRYCQTVPDFPEQWIFWSKEQSATIDYLAPYLTHPTYHPTQVDNSRFPSLAQRHVGSRKQSWSLSHRHWNAALWGANVRFFRCRGTSIDGRCLFMLRFVVQPLLLWIYCRWHCCYYIVLSLVCYVICFLMVIHLPGYHQ